MLFPPARDPALGPTPRPAELPALWVPWVQIAAIVVIATIVAWLSRFWPPTPLNANIWLTSSITIGFLANKDAARLFFAPFLALIFLAALVCNEATAPAEKHLSAFYPLRTAASVCFRPIADIQVRIG